MNYVPNESLATIDISLFSKYIIQTNTNRVYGQNAAMIKPSFSISIFLSPQKNTESVLRINQYLFPKCDEYFKVKI